MPAVKRIQTPNYSLLVWRIEEELSFFARALQLNAHEIAEFNQLSYPKRRLEWMAARYVQREVCNDSLIKDQWGKPHLSASSGHISLAHCNNYAAAIYSAKGAVGVDVEPIKDKVQRIADKFLTERELQLIGVPRSSENLIAAWSIKEAIYKWYGKKKLSFKQNIQLQKLSLQSTQAEVLFTVDNQKESKEVNIENIGDVVLAYL